MKGKQQSKKANDEELYESWAYLQKGIIALDEQGSPQQIIDRIINNAYLTKALAADFDGTVKKVMDFHHQYMIGRLFAVVATLGETLDLPLMPDFDERAKAALSWYEYMKREEAIEERRMIESLFGPGAIVGPD